MLTCLELIFLGLTGSNSGLFSTPGFIVSPVGKGERRKKKEKRRKEKGNRKGMEERKERRRNKKIRGKIRRRNFNKN